MGSDPNADRVRREMAQAEIFRQRGLEGRARVCARRAAGWAVLPVYRRQVRGDPPSNVVALLRWYSADEAAPPGLRQAARRLTVAVTPAHVLPHPEDPLDDARRIVEALLEASEPSHA
jgi:hypothetical protein